MKKRIFFIAIVISAVISSCTKTVDVDVPDAGNRLVIEASLDWELGTTGQEQSIQLSYSTAYFADNLHDPVIGATIEVTNSDMEHFTFVDQNNGNYTNDNFVAEVGQSYSLEILYNGQIYMAHETMEAVTNITRIGQSTEGGLNPEHIDVSVYFDDPAGVENYYLGEFTHPRSPVPSFWIIDDNFSDGNEMWVICEHEDLVAGDTVNINLYGITESYYHYMVLLVHQSSQFNGGPFQTTPVQVSGNCVNINDGMEEILGYFRLSQVDRTFYVIE
jgi:hypothetical protein